MRPPRQGCRSARRTAVCRRSHRRSTPSRCRPRAPAAGHRPAAATASRRTPNPSRWTRWSPSPRRPAGSRRGTPRGSAAPARRHPRPARPPGRGAGPDPPTLRRADAPGLTGGERREHVVVHIAPGLLRRERVELLLQRQHVQGGDTEDLSFPALEQRRAVHPGDHADLRGQSPDVTEPATVHSDLLAEHALAHQGLRQRPKRGADLLLAALELRPDLREYGVLDLVERGLTLELAGHG